MDDWTYPDLFNAFERSFQPGSKTSVFYNREMYLVIRFVLNRTEPPRLIQNRFIFGCRGLLFPANHFLFEIFDRKLQQYVEADLISYNILQWNDEDNPEKHVVQMEPFAILTLCQLEAGFVICLASLLLSFLVFCIEWMMNMKDLMIFHFIFKSYFNLKYFQMN